MNADKRSVFTDALETLGTIIDDTQKRDAIHLAVEPVIAKCYLQPGENVTADGYGKLPIPNFSGKEYVGIVDPFLKEPLNPGQRFWLVLYPRTIKSLRHIWEHPAFPDSEIQISSEVLKEDSEAEKTKKWISKKWIEDYVKEIKKWDTYDTRRIYSYDDLMKAADKWLNSDNDEWLLFATDNESLDENFWYHYEIVTGKKVEDGKKQNFFSCIC
jgi:hypothetical protein